MAQQVFSSETVPTVGRTLPVLEFMQEQWESFLPLPKFSALVPSIQKGLNSLRKYYKLTDNADANIICFGT